MAPWIMAVASFLARSEEQKKQRSQMRQQLLGQYAQQLGGGSDPEVEVAQFKQRQRDENGLGSLLPLIQMAGDAFGGDERKRSGPGGWTSQADYRGPGRVASAGYAGPISTRDF